ncbi:MULTISPECIES: AraC family transcriptional regulator [unclassified Streptomyces]|uniref:helix-turn-helix transcriptional regulator n=1 Tax=unclassified Streptomyces TaxID=2593676 RepID=UPI000DD5E743|nr:MULTISPECIES: AraC family transcriptional regulator [unclassified Streptomyces]QZZ28968.1 AraC family transcriptional regulator [Streptomyces sp. ST1015]
MDQTRIHDLQCMAPEGPVPGFEIGPLEELRGRVPEGVLERFNRVDFHTVTLITEGRGEHTVDFVSYDCAPGTLLWVRPGQVQRFGPRGKLKGTHLRFAPAFPPPFPGSESLLAPWRRQTAHTTNDVSLTPLTREYARPAPSREILRHLLAAVLLHIDRLPHPASDPRDSNDTYARFRAALEAAYPTDHRVDQYAARLGYTVRTLTRACQSATGRTAKQIIDDRIALQAQRLLAHTEQPISTIAHTLGFGETTNFSKFFTRMTGVVPGDFRVVHGRGVTA